MRSQERAALAAIIASGLVRDTRLISHQAQSTVVSQALAVADMILNQTDADEKTAYEREQRK